MNEAELVNRIWLILALACSSTYFLFAENNNFFLITAFVGALAIIHAERKANYHGWDSAVVLIAHLLAIVVLFATSLMPIFILFFRIPFFDDLNRIFVVLGAMVISFGIAGFAHNVVHDHYAKFNS